MFFIQTLRARKERRDFLKSLNSPERMAVVEEGRQAERNGIKGNPYLDITVECLWYDDGVQQERLKTIRRRERWLWK